MKSLIHLLKSRNEIPAIAECIDIMAAFTFSGKREGGGRGAAFDVSNKYVLKGYEMKR